MRDTLGAFVPGVTLHRAPRRAGPLSGLTFAETLGIHPRFLDNNRTGGSSFQVHAMLAALALDAGLCDVALIAYGSNQRSSTGKLVQASRASPWVPTRSARRCAGAASSSTRSGSSEEPPTPPKAVPRSISVFSRRPAGPTKSPSPVEPSFPHRSRATSSAAARAERWPETGASCPRYFRAARAERNHLSHWRK